MHNMDSIDKRILPLANYYALGHIHQIKTIQENGQYFVYPGPVFPNNFQELVDLQMGSFQITEVNDNYKISTENIKIPTKEIVNLEIEIDNGLTATEEIISLIDKHNLKDKIVLLKLFGIIKTGKTGDIQFDKIEEFIIKKGAYSFLRNISQLKTNDTQINLIDNDFENIDKIEEKVFDEYNKENPNEYNKYLPQLMEILSDEKNEDERSAVYEDRLISELKNTLDLGNLL
jgi:DNA repair exonuclease SbcCD nuclease subunit